MDSIVILEGIALKEFIDALTDSETYRVRLAIDGGGVKMKRNEGTWTLPYGEVERW
jgi:predicted NUDIX family NTP pyrophosphohydrolase